MYFYHYKIKESDSINHAVTGDFSGSKMPEIIVSRGRDLEILCIFKSVGDKAESLQRLLTVDFNARILSLEKVNGLKKDILTNLMKDFSNNGVKNFEDKDYVAIVSDSGKLVILEFDLKNCCFKPVREHILEKNKLEVTPRFHPGQYLAVDPKSQAIAVGAIEENLLFYALCNGPDESKNPQISKISKPRFIYFDLVPVFNDTGIPFFACLEAQYEELKSPYPPDIEEPSDSKKETDLVLDCPEKNSPKPTSTSANDFNTPVHSAKRHLEASSSSDDDFESIFQEKMQSRKAGKKKKNLKAPSLLSSFKKSSPLKDVATTVEDNFQSRSLLKVSDFTVDAISSRKHNLKSSNKLNVSNFTADAISSRKHNLKSSSKLNVSNFTADAISSRKHNLKSSNKLNVSNFTADAVSPRKDNLQTAKFLSDLNEPDSFMKFAKRFVEDYMRRSKEPSDCNEQNLSIGVAPSLKDNLQSPSLLNKPDSSLKHGVQLSSSTKNNLNEKKMTHKEFLNPILKTNSSDEISSDDEAYSIFNPLSFKKPPKKDENKLPPMVLRIYGWHWQSEKMFEYVFPLKKHPNKLISVPDGDCHKSGLLVCSCNRVDFLEIETKKHIHSFFPQRRNLAIENKKGMLISGSAIYKKDDKLLIILQSEEGDLYSAKIVKEDEQLNIKWTYIDTVPVASAMCIIEEKFLFLAADYGDHFLYKIKSLGSMENEKSHKIHKITDSDKVDLYIARQLTNLELLAGIENLAPVINCIAEDHVCIKNCISEESEEPDSITNELPDHVCNELLQFHFTCGEGSCSTLRTMRYGVEVIEWKSQKLPENLRMTPNNLWIDCPYNMWTYKEEINDDIVTFIVLSFSCHDKAMVLSISKEISVEPNDQFEGIEPKFENDCLLDYVQIDNDSSIQVFSRGVRYSFEDDKIEWILPPCDCHLEETDATEEADVTEEAELHQCEQHVLQCSIHKNQIALFLMSNELLYLEVLKSEERKFKFDERKCEYMPEYAACCMEFIPSNDRAEFLIVCFENTIQMFSVEDKGISKKSFAEQDLFYPPASLVVHSAANGDQVISYITIGFEGGYVQRFIFIHENKELENSFMLKLEDSETVTLIKTKIDEEDAIIALSTFCTWISFNCKTQFEFLPLLSEKIDCAVGFSSEYYPMVNLIAVLDERLVFLQVKKSPFLVSENRQQLELTPRQSAWVEDENLIVMTLSDYGKPYHKNGDVTPQHAMDITLGRTCYEAPNPTAKTLSEIVKNEPFSKYYSELRVYDPVAKQFVCESLKLPRDHSIVRMCVVEFSSKPDEWYIVAIVKKGSYKYEAIKRKPLPIIKSELYFDSYLMLYELVLDEEESACFLEEVCTMETDFLAEALCPFAGRVLVGIKDNLCLCNFETGLFMEANLKMPCKISNIYAHEDMFVVLCDNRNIIYGYYLETHVDEFVIPELRLLCEDQHLHKVTAICFWDQDLMVAADLFGYLNVVLTPAIPNDVLKKDYKLPTKLKRNESEINARENEEPNIEEYRFMPHSYVYARHYIGEIVTSLQTTSFLSESRDLFLYSTLSGSVGVLVPFFNEKPDIIFKPLQFLIKSKSQFHNKDSTDYPSSYLNRKKFNDKQHPMSDQSVTTLKSDSGSLDSTDSLENPENVDQLFENASPMSDESADISKSELNNTDLADGPGTPACENPSMLDQPASISKSELCDPDSVDEPANSVNIDQLCGNFSLLAKESSVKSKDECESNDSSDEPENSLNQFYEDDIVMTDESSTESADICDERNSTDKHENYSSTCQSFEKVEDSLDSIYENESSPEADPPYIKVFLKRNQTAFTSELLTTPTTKFENGDSSCESETSVNTDETCENVASFIDTDETFENVAPMPDPELPSTSKGQSSNKDSNHRYKNFPYMKKSSKKRSPVPRQSLTKLQRKFQSREPPLFVIDGNLCDLFHTLSEEDQRDIADYLEMKPYEISEKLAELKASMHFGVNRDWLEDES